MKKYKENKNKTYPESVTIEKIALLPLYQQVIPFKPQVANIKRRGIEIFLRLSAIAITKNAILLKIVLSQKTSDSFGILQIDHYYLKGFIVSALHLVSYSILNKSR